MLLTETWPKLLELTVEQAEAWVVAALAHEKALRQHEESLYPRSSDEQSIQTANLLRIVWQQWVGGAEILHQRMRPLLAAKSHIAGVHDLEYAIARARAMLKITPDEMRARREQLARGEVISAEEARRELRAAPGH